MVAFALSFMTEGAAALWATTFVTKALATGTLNFGTFANFCTEFKQSFIQENVKDQAMAWLSTTQVSKTLPLGEYISQFKNNQTNKYNLAISEKKNFRKIAQEPPTHHNLLLAELEREPPIFPDENFMAYLRKTPQIYVNGTNQYKKINGKLIPITIAKNSIASKLTQKAEEVSVTIPEEYLKFAKVFSEEAYQRMTPSRPYNHPILLNKTFIPKIGKVYPLSPDEQKATDNFIEENL